MKHILFLLTVLPRAPLAALHAADNIEWLINYDGKALPVAPWTILGKPDTKLEDGSLHLSDNSKADLAAFEAEWTGDLEGKEIVVEARVKLVSMVGYRDSLPCALGDILPDTPRYTVSPLMNSGMRRVAFAGSAPVSAS